VADLPGEWALYAVSVPRIKSGAGSCLRLVLMQMWKTHLQDSRTGDFPPEAGKAPHKFTPMPGVPPNAAADGRLFASWDLELTPAAAAAELGRWPKMDLTASSMWINIAIKYHIAEVRYENHPDDP
jgi:hypothetical protein